MEVGNLDVKEAKRVLIITSTPWYLKEIVGADKHELHIVSSLSQLKYANLNEYDVCLVFNFGHILPENLVTQSQLFNIHYSLLPKYRGPNPVRTALLMGDKYTGITIHKVTPEVDAGPIVYQEKIHIPPELNYKELFDYLTNNLLKRWEDILVLLSQDTLQLTKQMGEPTYTSLRCCNKRLVISNISRYTALEIYNRVRAFNPEPGVLLKVYIDRNKRYIALRRVRPVFGLKVTPGQLLYQKKPPRLILGTAYGGVVLMEGAIVGKKVLTTEQWISLKGRMRLSI